MISDDDKAKLRFELANANLQSIGRAQALYVTALLTYICLVWGILFVGSQATVHIGPLDLSAEGVWKITPFVILVLTLAYIGTVTAALPAFTELREAESKLFGSQDHSFFAFDTHKNVIDYLALLQLLPWSKTRRPMDDTRPKPWWQRLHHLMLPTLFVGSAFTSWWAVRRLSTLESSHHAAQIFGWSCLGLQMAYSIRPLWRYVGRAIGAKRTDNVYN
jgi:hypothetical protein